MPDKLNRLSYFVTVSSVKPLGFCHCYFLSFEFVSSFVLRVSD
jgi:hypothetical protein